jgi:3-oxoacyl-[acyl-carrier protein] reductase
MRLEGRVAAVTGGASGIGEAICVRLAAEGARVAVLDVDLEGAELTAALAGGGLAVEADVSDSAAVEAAVERVEDELGPLDVFVNNAGAVGLAHIERVNPRLEQQRAEAAAGGVTTALEALVRLTDEEWRRMLAIHPDGTFAFLASDDASYFVGATLSPNGGSVTF